MESSGIEHEPTADNLPKTTSINRVIKNSLFNVGAWGLNITIILLTTPFIVRKLTEEGYGVFALLTGLVGYYSLLDLGLGQGVTKFVAEYKANGDIDGINQAINAAIWIQVIVGLIVSSLLALFASDILSLLHVTPQYWADAKVSLYASAIGFFFTMVAGTLGSALMGLQRYDITSTVGGVTSSVLNILIVVALYNGFGLRHAMYLTLLSGFVLFIIYFLFLRKYLLTWRLSVLPDKLHLSSLFRYSSYMFISKSTSIFSNYIVRFVVAFFLGPISVTYYVVSSRLVNTISSLLYNGFIAIFPFASEVGTQKDPAKVQKLFLEASKIMAAFAFPLLLSTTFFAKPILSFWMGPEFAEKSWIVLSLLSLSGLVSSLSVVPNLLTMGLGYSRIIGVYSVISLLAYILLVPPLTKWGGVNGTAFGTILVTIPGILLVANETRNIFNMRRMEYLIKTMGFHFLATVIYLVIGLAIPKENLSLKSKELLYPVVFVASYFVFMVIFNWLPLHEYFKQVRQNRQN